MRALCTFVLRKLWGHLVKLAGRRSDAQWVRPEPWNSSLLDDIRGKRPWNVVVKALRRIVLLTRPRGRRGEVTVLCVNWETGPETLTSLRAVRHFSPATTRILVIDNASSDGSAALFEALPEPRRIVRLPANVGHALALDLGVCLARTEFVVVLDSDAFPVHADWLTTVLEPLRTGGRILAGSASKRGFVHPMYAALRRDDFLRRRLSWQPWRTQAEETDDLVWGEDRFDTGELLTRRLDASEFVLLPTTPNPVEGLPGMTAAGMVYHHGGVSRGRSTGRREETSWDAAVRQLLPPDISGRAAPGAG